MKNGALNSALTALLLLSMILSAYSCSEEVIESDKSKENSEQTEVVSAQANQKQDIRKYVKEKYEIPRDIELLYRIKKINKKLYFTGIEGMGYPCLLDIGAKKLETDCYDSVSSSTVYNSLTIDDKRYIVYFGRHPKKKLCCVNISDDKLIKETEMVGKTYPQTMHLDSDGNISILSVTDKKEAAFNVYSSDLDLLNTISLTENLQLSDNEIIYHVLNDRKGSYYFWTCKVTDDNDYINPVLCKISSSGELIYKSTIPEFDKVSVLYDTFTSKNGNLFIPSYNGKTGSLKLIEISNDTGEKINEYEIPLGMGDNYCNIISEDEESEYDFIYRTSEGIYGYTLSGDISSEILKFSDYPEINFSSYGFQCTNENKCVMERSVPSDKYNCVSVHDENNIAGRSKCTVSVGEFYMTSVVSDDGFIYKYGEDSIIKKINDSGEIISSYDFKNLSSEYPVLRKIIDIKNNKIYLEVDSNEENDHQKELLILNNDGTKDTEIKLKNDILIYSVISPDYLLFESGQELKIAKIDYENKSIDENTGLKNIDLSDVIPYPENLPSGSKEYDLYYKTDEGLFGCLLKEDKTDKLLDFAEYGLNSNDINVYWIDENEIIYGVFITQGGNKNGYYHLKRVE